MAHAAVDHGLEHFGWYNLRRTMCTHLASFGIRSEVAETCLGFELRGVEGNYNTHDHLSERRAVPDPLRGAREPHTNPECIPE